MSVHFLIDGGPANGSRRGGGAGAGRRTDLQLAGTYIVNGGDLTDFARERPDLFIKYGKAMRELQYTINSSRPGPRDRQRKVFCLVGPPGTPETMLEEVLSVWPYSWVIRCR